MLLLIRIPDKAGGLLIGVILNNLRILVSDVVKHAGFYAAAKGRKYFFYFLQQAALNAFFEPQSDYRNDSSIKENGNFESLVISFYRKPKALLKYTLSNQLNFEENAVALISIFSF